MIDLRDDLTRIDEELCSSTQYAYDLAYQWTLNALLKNIDRVETAWCRSCFGYLSSVYGTNFNPPSADMFDNLNRERAPNADTESWSDSRWCICTDSEVNCEIESGIERADIRRAFEHTAHWAAELRDKKTEVLGIIRIAQESHRSVFQPLADRVEELHSPTPEEIVRRKKPASEESKGPVSSQQEIHVPPHIRYHAKIMWSIETTSAVSVLRNIIGSTIDQFERIYSGKEVAQLTGNKIFIGHGRSCQWKALRDFLTDTLRLEYDEFNSVSNAGKATIDRLKEMLNDACFAFLVMTGEDVTVDGIVQARPNVFHETGLFQARLGFDRAIILLEDGCAEYSNIAGLGQIRFPKGDIMASSEEIRKILEKHGILAH